MTTDLDSLAAATHAAMVELPPYVVLGNALDTATTRDERVALLLDADGQTRAAALAYLDMPAALRERERRLTWLRADPMRWPLLKRYYANGHVADMADSWGSTLDPRLLARGGSAIGPFRLFPVQRRMFEFMDARYRNAEAGVIVKGRDIGASFCVMTWLTCMCLLHENFSAIIGSALEAKCDLSGSNQTLLAKARLFLDYLPDELRCGWTRQNGSAHMRIWFDNGSAITAAAGTAIGRGERASVVAIDEHAFVEHASAIDSAITATSDCRLYVSTVNGMDNEFARKAHNDSIPRMTTTVDDDPRKTAEWREKKIAADGLARFQREYLCDFLAGTSGQLIPREHLEACVDAHVKLRLEPTGRKYAGFDVGNGGDPSAFCVTRGWMVEHVESWPSSTNLMAELRKAFALADKYGVTEFAADCVGVGAGIVGDAIALNEERNAKGLKPIRVIPFKGSESPIFPERPSIPGSTVKAADAFANKKAQSFAWLQFRAAETFKAIKGEKIKDPDNILSISSAIRDRAAFMAEIGQICGEESPSSGKLKILKYGADESGHSPNKADALAIATCPRNMGWQIPAGTAERIAGSVGAPQVPLSVDAGFGPPTSAFFPPGSVW